MRQPALGTAATSLTTLPPSKIGPLPLAALTNADAAQWLNSLTGSAKTAANKHGFLAGALNAAVRARHISANPCDRNRLRRDEPAEMVFLTHEEFRLLLRRSISVLRKPR
ncbi:hypothetical protein [Mycobacterium sp.]|uniref:hypothetical protein n=1 Tax=Mycobacterium sp. TaxID=1785 RepID=UPI003F94E307